MQLYKSSEKKNNDIHVTIVKFLCFHNYRLIYFRCATSFERRLHETAADNLFKSREVLKKCKIPV